MNVLEYGKLLKMEDRMAVWHAVYVMRHGTIIGHIPQRISHVCSLFLRRGGQISCKVTGS